MKQVRKFVSLTVVRVRLRLADLLLDGLVAAFGESWPTVMQRAFIEMERKNAGLSDGLSVAPEAN
jgi:hypothetical protein